MLIFVDAQKNEKCQVLSFCSRTAVRKLSSRRVLFPRTPASISKAVPDTTAFPIQTNVCEYFPAAAAWQAVAVSGGGKAVPLLPSTCLSTQTFKNCHQKEAAVREEWGGKSRLTN